jgi:hypothetical protein
MRFAGQRSSGANCGRTRTRICVLKVAIIAVLAVAVADVHAESAMLSGHGSQNAASARIGFTIVIPAVLILDRRTGTFYTNDAKAIVALGALGSPRYTVGVDRDVSVQAGLRPVTAIDGGRAGLGQFRGRSTSGSTGAGHRFCDGEVICIP